MSAYSDWGLQDLTSINSRNSHDIPLQNVPEKLISLELYCKSELHTYVNHLRASGEWVNVLGYNKN
jgi:hypothetical protein